MFGFISLEKVIDLLHRDCVNSPVITNEIVTGATTDTRSLKPGELFFALRGEHFNGHDFLAVAKERGAIAAVVDYMFLSGYSYNFQTNTTNSDDLLDLRLFPVEDTLQAYQQLARWWRGQFAIPIIAVTGSVGKTTTKELIAAFLQTNGQVLKSEANHNNEIGVPKTLLQLDSSHDYAVVEMGMRGPNEIALLTQIACPDVAVITNVGTAHIGRLGSEMAIAQAKCELLVDMPTTGIAILNHDNPLLLTTAAQVWQGEQMTFGFTGGDLQGEYRLTSEAEGIRETLWVEGYEFPLPLSGQHNALNYLAGLAVAKVLGIDWSPLTQGIQIHLPTGRARRQQLPNGVLVLDETYNAGLESMIAALKLLAQVPAKRHFAVLGTMKELGERSYEFHQQVGEMAKQLGLEGLLVVVDDPETEGIAIGAVGIPLIEQFHGKTAEIYASLVQRLINLVQPGDCLLFKASHSVGLSEVVEAFCSQA